MNILKMQIGPVQDFIAQARSTRDLWSGSYLLSWLMAAGIVQLHTLGGELIFPNPKDQPLLKPENLLSEMDQQALLTPNLPNLFVAQVPSDQADAIAATVVSAIRAEWEKIADKVWTKAGELGIKTDKAIFDNSVGKQLSITWQITPVGGDYEVAYKANGKHHDAVRQTRDFKAWRSGGWSVGGEKDSLTGRDESLCGGTTFAASMQQQGGEIRQLFKHSDHVGAITLIKRIWHAAYLRRLGFKTRSHEFVIRSIPAIAARKDELDDERQIVLEPGEKYIAAIAFDGDSIGHWVSGERLPDGADLKEHHQKFSAALSDFALNRVRNIVEREVDGTDSRGNRIKVPLGQLIYAGGDDVVALVPADAALDCTKALRNAFRASTESINDKEGQFPDSSAGIAISHVHAPLQDLIRAAQLAEKRAKNIVGRPAFSVTLLKRSGEITEWGSRWTSGGVDLYKTIADLLGAKKLSAKFPHRVCQLLAPYLNHGRVENGNSFDAVAIIAEEFRFAISRQSATQQARQNEAILQPLLGTYLRNLDGNTQKLITAIIGLCTIVAFAHRTRLNPQPAARETAA